MANYVKAKVGVSALSISIIILIPLLKSNFNTPVTIKRWSELTWNDFQGLVRPFSKYDAAISSAVYLEYDSTEGRYYAYAGQNNVWSWVNESKGEYLLNHEQYHFNITELHARKLNDYIEENPDGTEYLYNLRLGSINIDLREMQDKYDSETGHSRIFDKQRRWEYEIDSLLVMDSGWVTDNFSGLKIFFPKKPQLVRESFENESVVRGYRLKKYSMTLAVYAYQTKNIDLGSFENNWHDIYSPKALKVKSVVSDTIEYPLKTLVMAEDTFNYTDYSLWVYNNMYLYKVHARYPNNTGDTTGYAKIARSFINSFRIINTDSYWVQQLAKTTSPIVQGNITKLETSNQDQNLCISLGKQIGLRGFSRGPFFRDDGGLLLA